MRVSLTGNARVASGRCIDAGVLFWLRVACPVSARYRLPAAGRAEGEGQRVHIRPPCLQLLPELSGPHARAIPFTTAARSNQTFVGVSRRQWAVFPLGRRFAAFSPGSPFLRRVIAVKAGRRAHDSTRFGQGHELPRGGEGGTSLGVAFRGMRAPVYFSRRALHHLQTSRGMPQMRRPGPRRRVKRSYRRAR